MIGQRQRRGHVVHALPGSLALAGTEGEERLEAFLV